MKNIKIIASIFLLSLSLFACKQTEEKRPQPSPTTAIQEDEKRDASYRVEEDALYIEKNTLLSNVEAPEVRKVIFNKNIEVYDTNRNNHYEHLPIDYVSHFQHCPNIEEIQVIEGEQKEERKGDGCTNLFVENDMLMYQTSQKGVYACLPNKQGIVEIPENTRDIFDCAFVDCNQIEKIVIPSSVRWVGSAAFGNMEKCKEIVVKNSKYLKTVDGVLYTKDGKVLIAYPAGKKDKEFRVPDGVKVIGNGAFMGVKHIEKIILPDNMLHIGEKAFAECENLKEVASNTKVKYMMQSAWDGTNWPRRPERKKYINSFTEGGILWEGKYQYLSYLYEEYKWKFDGFESCFNGNKWK